MRRLQKFNPDDYACAFFFQFFLPLFKTYGYEFCDEMYELDGKALRVQIYVSFTDRPLIEAEAETDEYTPERFIWSQMYKNKRVRQGFVQMEVNGREEMVEYCLRQASQ